MKTVEKNFTEDREHARRSPSSYKYLKECPAYIPEKKTEEELHPNTLRGIAMHEAIRSGDMSSLDDKEVRWVKWCQAERDRVSASLFFANMPIERLKEDRVVISKKHHSFGYYDELWLQKMDEAGPEQVGLLFDWKFGWVEVDSAEFNLQGKGYAVGVFDKYPKLSCLSVCFIQPAIKKTTLTTFTRKDLPKLRRGISSFLQKGEACDGSFAKRVEFCKRGEYCLYCQRSKDLTCPLMSTTLKVIETRIKGLTLPAEFNPDNLPTNPEELVSILKVKTIIEKIFDATSDRIKELLESGVEVPGAQLTYVNGRTNISDPNLAWKKAKEAGLTDEEITNCVSLSLSDLKKYLTLKAPRGEKEIAVERFVNSLSEAGILTEGPIQKRLKLN